MEPTEVFASPSAVSDALETTGYLADQGLSTVTFLAHQLARPLLLEGEPGTGKTALAEALAAVLGRPLVRLQCYEGIDATQALYDWDFPRQILHLRAVEALAAARARGIAEPAALGERPGQAADAAATSANPDAQDLEAELFDERFLLARPVLRALRESQCVLLIDEIDRADDEFEARKRDRAHDRPAPATSEKGPRDEDP